MERALGHGRHERRVRRPVRGAVEDLREAEVELLGGLESDPGMRRSGGQGIVC